MTAAPSLQFGLFDAPAAPKTQVCAVCKRTRKVALFAWADAAKTIRGDTCNTCRMKTWPADSEPTAKAPTPKKTRSDELINAPHPSGFIPTPTALWAKPGDTVKFLVNDDRTGLTLCIEGVVTGVKPTSKLVSGYTRLRNFLVGRGWQIAQIRGSVAAPLLAETARVGRTDG